MPRKSPKNVGLIGLGIIGSRVAAGLRNQGWNAFVWNRTPKPVPNFLGSAAEVARTCDIIQLFVADAPATTLFAAFYEALTKPGPPISQAEALRQAMLVTRQADGGKWAHPAFWAGFGLIGAAKGL